MKKIGLYIMSVLFLSACGGSTTQLIQGAGATFPAPLYNKVFADYKAETDVSVSYQGIGSGGGIQNIASGIVDIGATDAFLSDQEIAEQTNELLHIPGVLAAVNFTYHVPGIEEGDVLSLDPATIYAIYNGDITYWNDPKIQALNPVLNLPELEIIPVYRSDSSGTTFIMAEFMSKANEDWESTFGTSKTINWVTGVGQKGNSSMMGFAKENPGAIAYVDLVYARQNGFPVAKIKNKAGNYVIGDVENATLAALGAQIPKDTRVSLTYTAGQKAAPMATFSYLLVRKEQNYNKRSLEQAQELVKLLQWMYTPEVQASHTELYFAPLPKNVVQLGLNIIGQITYDGKAVVDTL